MPCSSRITYPSAPASGPSGRSTNLLASLMARIRLGTCSGTLFTTVLWSRPLVNSTVNAVRAMYSSLSCVCVQIKHRKRKGDRRIVRFVSFLSGNRVGGPGAAKTKRIRPARPSRSSRDWRRSAIHRGRVKRRSPTITEQFTVAARAMAWRIFRILYPKSNRIACFRNGGGFSHGLHPTEPIPRVIANGMYAGMGCHRHRRNRAAR